MSGFRGFIVGILSAIIIVVLAIFAVENLQGVTAHFFGSTFTPGLWWVAIGSAVLGFILAFLLLAPGRVASGWRARGLERSRLRAEQETSVLRQEHESLRAQHAHMQAEREGLQTERDQLRARLTAVNNASSLPASAGAAERRETTEAADGASYPRTAGYGTRENAGSSYDEGYNAGAASNTSDTDAYYGANRGIESGPGTAPPARGERVTRPNARMDAAAPEAPTATPAPADREQQLGVGGRLKSMFSRQREEHAENAQQDEQSWNNNQPPVPSA